LSYRFPDVGKVIKRKGAAANSTLAALKRPPICKTLGKTSRPAPPTSACRVEPNPSVVAERLISLVVHNPFKAIMSAPGVYVAPSNNSPSSLTIAAPNFAAACAAAFARSSMDDKVAFASF